MLAKKSKVLVTGGAGYIGSHACVELIQEGYEVVIVDNYQTSFPSTIDAIYELTKKDVRVIQGDLQHPGFLDSVFEQTTFDAVIHFAGLKSAVESISDPLRYYENNVSGTIQLLTAMARWNLKTIVFSSSAAVYGAPNVLPLSEDHPMQAVSPYGRTKVFNESILKDLYAADNEWRIAILRYFNPIGAHQSGLMGERPKQVAANIMPSIIRVATGVEAQLTVCGDDYDTPDGTGVRDYVHVMDVAKGHVKALQTLDSPQLFEINLGTGRGYSVKEVVQAFESVSNRHIPLKFEARREGDVAVSYANTHRARQVMGWEASKDLKNMCEDLWNFYEKTEKHYNAESKTS
ncbi:UDP-glucose 4-epimerase GalE [Agrobacterium pusense]|jgi:UDP-glucose 4-epimerase|uniref:UDP-glucose 4-epimerase GalE n=1 Tax=Agrobacterium pusense TaxID=648995 RepID=UPI0024534810|nr:UDP-glucose 4-epimerase GalE [Agrobacterium pusense]